MHSIEICKLSSVRHYKKQTSLILRALCHHVMMNRNKNVEVLMTGHETEKKYLVLCLLHTRRGELFISIFARSQKHLLYLNNI